LPQRKTSPKFGLAVLISVLASGSALLFFVFVRKAWQSLEKDPASASKIAQMKKYLLG
jgi:uncharacterized protein involved in exopolysaccharide biosynthesis